MAGFRNVIPPLGVYSGAVAPPDGGFDTPIPALRLSAGATISTPDGGFGTPIGALLIRSARKGGAGFVNVIPPIRMYAKSGQWTARHEQGADELWPAIWERRYEDRDMEELHLFMSMVIAIDDEYN